MRDQIKIGYIKSCARCGDRVTVYFPNGKSAKFIASNDLTSTKVAVIGDRAFSEDVAQQQLAITTKLFKSKSNYQEENLEYPWAYLFEINDFAAMTGKNNTQINYTDTSWGFDEAEGYIRQLADGGGSSKTEPQFDEDNFIRASTSIELMANIYANMYGFDPKNQYGFEPDTSGEKELSYTIRSGDAVMFPNNGGSGMPQQFFQGTRDSNESIGFIYFAEAKLDSVDPSRRYYIKQYVGNPDYKFTWSNSNQNSQTGIQDIYTVEIEGDSQGETLRRYTYGRIQYNNGQGTVLLSFQSTKRRGQAEYYFPTSYYNNSSGYAAEIAKKDAVFAQLVDYGYEEISWDTAQPPGLDGVIFTAQEILDGATYSQYQGTIRGKLPRHPDHNPPNIYDYSLEIENHKLRLEIQNPYQTIYDCYLFIEPKSGRTPGVKKIYAQVRENTKVLLHEIPSFEPWDGYMSPLPTGEIEVVLKCAKKFHRRSDDPSLNKIPNTMIGNYYYATGDSFFSREWSQVRVYTLDSSGGVERVRVYNNSDTDLNSSNTPDLIEVDELNWQKSWLDTYQDKRSPSKENRTIDPEFRYLFRHGIGYGENNQQQNTPILNLNSAYNFYFGEIPAGYMKGIETTKILRGLIGMVNCGTLTSRGFVYLDPQDLLDKNVAVDKSPVSRLFPNANYSIVSRLFNTEDQYKVRYYLLSGSSYGSGFTSGVSIEKLSNFPKLDLGINLPKKITQEEWNVDWENTPGVNASMRTFGIRAIAYLEN